MLPGAGTIVVALPPVHTALEQQSHCLRAAAPSCSHKRRVTRVCVARLIHACPTGQLQPQRLRVVALSGKIESWAVRLALGNSRFDRRPVLDRARQDRCWEQLNSERAGRDPGTRDAEPALGSLQRSLRMRVRTSKPLAPPRVGHDQTDVPNCAIGPSAVPCFGLSACIAGHRSQRIARPQEVPMASRVESGREAAARH